MTAGPQEKLLSIGERAGGAMSRSQQEPGAADLTLQGKDPQMP